MTSSQPATRRPFTVALCRSCRAQVGLEVVEALRATIRRCDHGVLVVTECMLGVLSCGTPIQSPGVMVLLQPCSIDRFPSGPPHWIGPINDNNDVSVVCDWVQRGEWNCRALPARLRRQAQWTASVARRN